MVVNGVGGAVMVAVVVGGVAVVVSMGVLSLLAL